MSQERQLRLSEDALRQALRPGPEITAPVDFALNVRDAIRGRPQLPSGRLAGSRLWPRQLTLLGRLLLILALLVALIIGAIVARSLQERPFAAGPLFVAQADQLAMIDARSGRSTPVVDDPRGIFGVARSTDGERVSFWTGRPEEPGTTLEIANADGTGRRVVAENLTPAPVGRGGIDVWSGDGRYLASGVSVSGVDRILVVEIASGEGRLIGPPDGAENPLFSPDGAWLAFTHEQSDGRRTLAVMRPDGSGLRDVSTELEANVSGPDNWSADGGWVYFDAFRPDPPSVDIYRLAVESGVVEQLTDGQTAAAPALAPDDSQVAFMVWIRTRNGQSAGVWVMTSDGSSPHLLVEDASLRGWSPDSRYVLVVQHAADDSVQLVAITPDGGERHVLLSLESCSDPCLENLSWGWPRP